MAVLIIMLMKKRNSHQNYSDYTLSDDETVDQKNASASIVNHRMNKMIAIMMTTTMKKKTLISMI